MGPVLLENHCRRRLDRARFPWAAGAGFVHTAWIDDDGAVSDVPPRPGEARRLFAGAPFEAAPGEPVHVLWEPAAVAVDGWEPERQARLAEVRVVTCALVDVIAPVVRGVGRSPSAGLDLRVDVLAVRDPLLVEPRAAAAEVAKEAWPFGDRPQTLQVWRAPDRVLVAGSVEGDVNVDLLVDAAVERVALVVDTSLCEGFFWFGAAPASPALQSALRRLL